MLNKLAITQFDGGISLNTKTGLPGSYRFARNLDIYSDDDSCQLNPRAIRDDGGIVTDLVMDSADARPFSTTRYFYGNTGNIYANNNGVWTVDHTVATQYQAYGQGMGLLSDTLFYTTATTLGYKQYLSQGGTYNDDFLSDGVNNIDVTQTASGFNYNVPVSLSELAQDSLSFTGALALTKDPMKSVVLNVSQKGSGDWTVYLHDVRNIVVAQVTIVNALMVNGNNTFTFTTPGRINLGKAGYHLHVVSTASDGQIQTGVNQNINTAQFSTQFGILVADALYHPVMQHVNGVTGIIAIGNERYIATYDMNTYLPNKITLEPGYSVRGFTKFNEFLVAFCWKGGGVDKSEYGRAYYWDGISSYFNYYEDITPGNPNALINFKNRVFGVVGVKGIMTLGTSPYRTLQWAPKLSTGSLVETKPKAIGVWHNNAVFGYSSTNDPSAGTYVSGAGGSTQTTPLGLEPGVYALGDQTDRALSYTSVSAEVLSYAWQTSSGPANPTQYDIGCIAPYGTDLYISWKDGGTYGVDRVSQNNPPCTTGSWESLIIDQGLNGGGQIQSMPQHTKNARQMAVTFSPLPVGATVTPKYRLNRSSVWIYGTPQTTVGSTSTLLNFSSLGGARFREIEIGFDLTASSINYQVTGVYFEYDLLETEASIN